MAAIPGLIKELLMWHFDLFNTIGEYVYSFYSAYSRSFLDLLHAGFEHGFEIFLVMTIILAGVYLFMAFSVLLKHKKMARMVAHGKEPNVTIQIPTFNELAALNCARRCIEFDYPKDKMQIIIGDDSNDPQVSRQIDAFASRHPGLVIVTRRGNNAGYKPGNLNHMLKYTTGEYIVIFDSDFLPEKHFLRTIIAPFASDRNIAVVQARWALSNFSQNIYSILGGSITFLCHNVALSFIDWYDGNSFLCGSAEAIRKKDLVKAGGWKEGSLTEDIECSLRLIKSQKRLVYLEGLECECEAPHTFQDLCKQQMRWSYGVVAAFKSHFWTILKSSKVRARDKFAVGLFGSGYFFSFLLLAITITGFLAMVSHEPAPIDWPLFLSETSKNILFTSGFLISTIVALYAAKKITYLPKMLIASFSVGLVVTYFVNVGILKALFGREMKWFMLKKNGNEMK